MTIYEQIAVMQAFADGKAIECKLWDHTEGWVDVISPQWDWPNYKYRIKPDPMPEVGDVIWLIDNDNDNKFLHVVYSVDELNRLVTVYRQLDCYGDPITRTIRLEDNWTPFKK